MCRSDMLSFVETQLFFLVTLETSYVGTEEITK